MFKILLKWTGIVIVAALIVIQLVPYGRDHDNPPVTSTVNWDSPRTAQLLDDACADCNSDKTDWPWNSKVAPMSWLIQRDVEQGREEFNISTAGGIGEAHEAAETIEDGSMPPRSFNILHPEAHSSGQEKQDLLNEFIATFG